MGFVSFVPMGRAGNYFFECAATWAYAKRHGLEFSAPKRTNSEFWNPLYITHMQHSGYNPNEPQVRVNEKNFHYDELPFDESWRGQNILLQGYFQSWRYFHEYRNEMLAAFSLPWELKPDVCSIQARYGDYLTIPGKHIVIDEEFITKSMAVVKVTTGISRFKVFSDDLPLFKERHENLYDFEYSTNGGIMEDMIEASCCHSNIGSSSTFAWWIAYLNKNPDKVVIFDHRWFQEGWKENTLDVNTKDLLLPEWIKI